MPETFRKDRPRLLIIGSSNTDLVVSSARLPRPGETLLGGQFQRFPGGKGANQAVAAARAGAKVTFVGACGDDDFGRRTMASLKREKINLSHFQIRKGFPSGIALIMVGGLSRENMISVAASANDSLSEKDIVAALPAFDKADVVIAQLEIPIAAVIAAAKAACDAGVPFLLNPAPTRRLPRTLWKYVHTCTPNEHEATLLTDKSDPERAGRKLLRLGCRHVVVTLGSRGALLVDATGVRRFPAPKVKPIDTVGAGDCFSAWLGVGIGEGLSMERNLHRALQAASLSVTRLGAQASMPYRREITG